MPARGFHPSRRAEKTAFAICVAVCAGLLLLPDAAQLRVADSLGAVTTGPFFRLRDFIEDVARVKRNNAELRAEVAALELERGGLARLRRDADRLVEAAGLRAAGVGALQPCEVVARRSGRLPSVIKIRSAQPVLWRVSQPVITPTGLLGRVKQPAGSYEAWVELLTSPDLALGCEIERNGVLGILRPRDGDFVLDMVGRDEDVVPGDRILTSGIAELHEAASGTRPEASFPRGLPVGLVSEVSAPPDRLFKTIRVSPLASLRRNDVVFVVTAPGEWFLPALPVAAADSARADSTAVGAAADSAGAVRADSARAGRRGAPFQVPAGAPTAPPAGRGR
ncbi:MAG: rod shape-determining protein MreC [Candidatus Krumholzibacteriia bacterium]